MRKIDKLAMGKGYEEMANINLTIAQEDFHLEQEGERAWNEKRDLEKSSQYSRVRRIL